MSGLAAAVTGGAGFIGRHVVAALRAEGSEVRVLDRAPRPAGFPEGVRYIEGSILDAAACGRAFAGADEIYHIAGHAHLWARDKALFGHVNHEGTRVVLAAAQAAGAKRIVVTSTETILRGWRDPNPAPVRENEPLPPPRDLAGPYSRSKALAHGEALKALAAGAPLRIVYPTVPLGAGDDALTPPTAMIRDFLLTPPPAFLDCRLNLADVEDIAKGHILAARQGVPGGRYILGGADLWLHELLALIEALTGRPMPRRRIPFFIAYGAGLVSTLMADCVTRGAPAAPLEGVRLARVARTISSERAARELGYAPRPVREALGRAIAWLTQTGRLA